MRIKMLETIGEHHRGKTIPVNDKVGERYIAAGFAERVGDSERLDDLAEAIAVGVARGLADVSARFTSPPIPADILARVANLEAAVQQLTAAAAAMAGGNRGPIGPDDAS